MTSLSVIPDVAFPLDAVTQKLAWLGRTGSGKSFACKRFVEEMLRANAQVLVVDTVGIWFGLRQGPRGFDIPVLGGLYGDIPLEPTAGALVAEVVVSSGQSLVLDVSQMTDGQRARFMEHLGRRLFELKKASPSAMHVVLDEGQDTVPQNVMDGEKMMLHEWVRICKQGRAFGIGVSIVSQRPQEINKKALNQVECVLAFQLTGPQERKALEYWLSDKGLDAGAVPLGKVLPALEMGTPFVWSPQWLKIAQVCGQVLPIQSADTSQTPKVGDAPRTRQAMKPIDLRALEKSMAEMVERVRDGDPLVLRRRIRELEAQIAGNAPTEDREVLLALVEAVEKRDEQLGAAIDDAVKAVEGSADALSSLGNAMALLMNLLVRCKLPPLQIPNTPRAAIPARQRKDAAAPPAPRARPRTEPPAVSNGETRLPTGDAAVLKAAFQCGERGVSIPALALMTGYKTRSIANYLVSLSGKGLIERNAGRTFITEAGKAAIPKGTKPYPEGRKLLKHLIETLPEGESRVLAVVKEAHPDAAHVSKIQEKTGYAPRSISNYLVALVSRQALRRGERGYVRLHQELT